MRLVAGLSFKPCRVCISEPGRSLPLINLQFVADCKAQNPNFGQRNALPSQAVEPPVQISPPQPAAIPQTAPTPQTNDGGIGQE
jgi:hypothetical protein